jgi:hypothetical protein
MLGGPIVIPNVYNGRNKTFFFADFEGTRIRQALPFTSSVPTANERASGYTNFSDLIAGQSGSQTDPLGRSFALGMVFEPATTRAVTAGVADPVTGRGGHCHRFCARPVSEQHRAGKPAGSDRNQNIESHARSEPPRHSRQLHQ